MQSLADEAVQRLGEFSPQHIMNTAARTGLGGLGFQALGFRILGFGFRISGYLGFRT